MTKSWIILPAALALCSCMTATDRATRLNQVAPTSLYGPGVQTISMTSSSNGREYAITIAVPREAPPPEGHPIIYVLDGNWMFGTALEAARRLGPRGDVAEPIVVGIGYPDGENIDARRALDLTPASPEAPAGTGGSAAFLAFIENQLKPEIRGRLPVDNTGETIIGHSFGGLFVLAALLDRPDSFDTYVSASPSIWFGATGLERLKTDFVARLNAMTARPTVLMTVGQFEQAADPDFPPPNTAMLISRQQIDNARAFQGYLQNAGLPQTELQLIDGEDHMTVVPVAVGRGVRFALRHRRAGVR
jgi:uncharacterized protein